MDIRYRSSAEQYNTNPGATPTRCRESIGMDLGHLSSHHLVFVIQQSVHCKVAFQMDEESHGSLSKFQKEMDDELGPLSHSICCLSAKNVLRFVVPCCQRQHSRLRTNLFPHLYPWFPSSWNHRSERGVKGISCRPVRSGACYHRLICFLSCESSCGRSDFQHTSSRVLVGRVNTIGQQASQTISLPSVSDS